MHKWLSKLSPKSSSFESIFSLAVCLSGWLKWHCSTCYATLKYCWLLWQQHNLTLPFHEYQDEQRQCWSRFVKALKLLLVLLFSVRLFKIILSFSLNFNAIYLKKFWNELEKIFEVGKIFQIDFSESFWISKNLLKFSRKMHWGKAFKLQICYDQKNKEPPRIFKQ